MGKCHHPGWNNVPSSFFRRMILDALRCGGGGRGHKKRSPPDQPPPRSECEYKKPPGSDNKLSDLLRLSELSEDNEEEEDIGRKMQMLEELKRVVKCLQSSDSSCVLDGAKEVRRLTKDDSQARTNLALLGAIPPLISLLDDSQDSVSHIASLYALLNLAIANDPNKAAIVKSGAIHKMLKLVTEFPNPEVAEAVVANFLGLSALDSNKPIIGSSGAIAFLVKTLKNVDNNTNNSCQEDSLRALYNLSISPLNVFPILETDLIQYIMSKLGDMDVSERILSILCNVVSVAAEARKAINSVPDAFSMLIDVLSWADAPGCQEKASYILMVMAHKSYGDRQAMIEAGVASALLELTLLGSTLAQKRASRILECLRVDKGKQVSENYGGGMSAAISAPQASTTYSSTVQLKDRMEDAMMSEEKKAVKQLVQQSLQNNMKRIVKRANLPHEFLPSDHLKTLTSSSTSKSVPF
ncbi:U-box domain-containing protein 45 [Lycium barbarum]|uniref:U-box domain-containing protein 45 n=1 Tax=Lycium barbarum TaxID=112863 RepID=UPI00293E1048|nr:U-box domain-containing protein 45 [Lycium barbarum]XP_060214343.1 U-box domain-containing protein 45 [Lycium barbarum]XP_060214344.1 U-box domain-containing protein 45 [Lycium barbarum]